MTIQKFQKTILNWFVKNGRHELPWRPPSLKLRRDGTYNPYKILVSEIMLQQTQVDRVIAYYRAFLRAFPTAKKLADASPADVLKIWKGLGYNRRALYLKRAAEMITRDYKGRFPRAVEEIKKLPGVGHYTARAVAVFAFNQPHVFIETNIRRVFIHTFFSKRKEVSDHELIPIIHKTLFKKNPRLWYSALMDYGALALIRIENPNRKSRHHTKQSRFKGSRRYARAKILDFLLNNKSASLAQLQEFFHTDIHLDAFFDRPVLLGILTDLANEGFLVKKSYNWSLKK